MNIEEMIVEFDDGDFLEDGEFSYSRFKQALFSSDDKPHVSDLNDDDLCRWVCTRLYEDGKYTGQNFPNLYFKAQTFEEGQRVKNLVDKMLSAGYLHKELLNPKAESKRHYIFVWTIGESLKKTLAKAKPAKQVKGDKCPLHGSPSRTLAKAKPVGSVKRKGK
ncbi:hypothetical protein GEO02_23015 [Escherichia coli]|nr:hypothetical protein [Escherichia coli]